MMAGERTYGAYLGSCRTALRRTVPRVAGDLDEVYEDLASKDAEFLRPPVEAVLSGQAVRRCCFDDRDGTVLELFADRVH